MVGDDGGGEEARHLEPSVAVGCAQHRDLDLLVAELGDAVNPLALDHPAALELHPEDLEERNSLIQVVDDDAHVVHPECRGASLRAWLDASCAQWKGARMPGASTTFDHCAHPQRVQVERNDRSL